VAALLLLLERLSYCLIGIPVGASRGEAEVGAMTPSMPSATGGERLNGHKMDMPTSPGSARTGYPVASVDYWTPRFLGRPRNHPRGLLSGGGRLSLESQGSIATAMFHWDGESKLGSIGNRDLSEISTQLFCKRGDHPHSQSFASR